MSLQSSAERRRKYRDKFDSLFPLTYELDERPPIWRRGTEVPGMRVPLYGVGWVLIDDEVLERYPSPRYPYSMLAFQNHFLQSRWGELNLRELGGGRFRPFISDYGPNKTLCTFIWNSSDESIDHFLKHKDEVFDAMCELFQYTEEEKEETRLQFKWYRHTIFHKF